MLDLEAKNLLHIENRYKEIKEFCIGEEIDNIYNLTPHSLRYNILKYTLKPISLGFKLITLGFVSLKYFNISNILLNKMDQSISKKISEGISKEVDEAIPQIVEYIFNKYQEQPELVEPTKPSLLEKFTTKIKEYVPYASKFINFWDQGGIKYSKEMIETQELVEIIYKRIISAFYIAGKNGKTLEIEDVKNLFPEIKFEEKVELVNTESVKIEQPEKTTVTVPNNTINPLVKLMMLKALYDGVQQAQQEMVEIYQEQWAIAESIEYSQTIFTPYPKYDLQALAHLENSYNYFTPNLVGCAA